MLDLHRHDEYSSFDGFGNANELAKLARLKGHTALGIANHGNANGLVQHYFACKKEEIKPVLGVEAYFQPSFNKENPRYHLCIFVKDLEGYGNLNRLLVEAESTKYYNPIVTIKNLQKHKQGLIVTSGCIGGYISQMLVNGKDKLAYKAAETLKALFGDDFYIEIQPYVLEEDGLQERANIKNIELAEKLNIKCILTSDSHYGDKEDLPTYLKMHEIGRTRYDVLKTYGERYMPTEQELIDRFIDMHSLNSYHVAYPTDFALECIENLNSLEAKVDGDILDKLELKLPEFIEGKSSYKVLLTEVQDGLKRRNKHTKKYIDRCKEELEVIKYHGFSDYFLIVQDYVKWAKNQGIAVGPGRGSVCNSQVAWALGITDVDSLKFDLDFRRFLRKDKKSLPDIDLDFQTSRREEVIRYIVNKYKGHSAQICSYGNYMIDNLLNDLVKVCGMEDIDDIKSLKKFVRQYCPENNLDYEAMKNNSKFDYYNDNYDDILIHFKKLFKKVRFIGTHAAGVAVTGNNILDYSALRIDSKTGNIFTVYNLADLENINVIKFDILGLKTMEQLYELRELTGDTINEDSFEDPKLFEQFQLGSTDGVFQFESNTAKQILRDINCDCFEDVIAASSMNRPGPLALKQPEQYAHNKFNAQDAKDSKFWEYTKATYGTIVYQEQLQQICINIGGMTWEQADRTMKCLKNVGVEAVKQQVEKDKKELTKIFVEGAVKNGFTKLEAKEMFAKVLVYTFNKGHSAGYSIISLEEMFFKVYHPTEYWYIKCKYAARDADLFKYRANAVTNGVLVFLPHVNYSSDYTLREIDGERVIQEGLKSIKFVGEKAADFIEAERVKNGNYKSIEDFMDRCAVKGSGVNKRVVEKLIENGALEFNKKTYLNRVTKYNSTLYMKGVSTSVD